MSEADYQAKVNSDAEYFCEAITTAFVPMMLAGRCSEAAVAALLLVGALTQVAAEPATAMKEWLLLAAAAFDDAQRMLRGQQVPTGGLQ